MDQDQTPTQPTRKELVMQIRALADEGYSSREIGRKLGIPFARVQRISMRHRIRLAGTNGCRRVSAWIRKQDVIALDKVAEAAGISRGAMFERLARCALEDGGKTARRLLGKRALPKRRYVKKADEVVS